MTRKVSPRGWPRNAMKTFPAGLCVAVLLTAPPGAHGQPARFELGQRLRAFELAWEEATDRQARARAVPHLTDAVRQFFGFRWARAGESLDRARLAVQSAAEPEPAIAWATSLSVRPASRMVEEGAEAIGITLAPFYPVATDVPDGAVFHGALRNAAGEPVGTVEAQVSAIPWEGAIPAAAVPDGDYRLTAEIRIGGDSAAMHAPMVSIVANAAGRLEALDDRLARLPAGPEGTLRATATEHRDLLRALFARETPETDYPAARLLAEAEAMLDGAAMESDHFWHRRPGEFWVTLAGPGGRTHARVFAPEAVAKGEPLPLVLALHGAGGSENMFFDAYGAGKIVDLCRQRGWLLVAPRLGFLGLGMSADRLLAEIARLYPVDGRRVFVVGHSMGAAQAVRLAQEASEPFAAVAAIGGGGRVGSAGPWTQTPFLVIAGDQDFGLPAARRLAEALRAAGAPSVQWKEYPDTEHLGIVQASLPEVSAFFDPFVPKPASRDPGVPAGP